jgi:hypothetical protein
MLLERAGKYFKNFACALNGCEPATMLLKSYESSFDLVSPSGGPIIDRRDQPQGAAAFQSSARKPGRDRNSGRLFATYQTAWARVTSD